MACRVRIWSLFTTTRVTVARGRRPEPEHWERLQSLSVSATALAAEGGGGGGAVIAIAAAGEAWGAPEGATALTAPLPLRTTTQLPEGWVEHFDAASGCARARGVSDE